MSKSSLYSELLFSATHAFGLIFSVSTAWFILGIPRAPTDPMPHWFFCSKKPELFEPLKSGQTPRVCVGMKTDHIHIESNPDITFYDILIQRQIFKYEYKTDVLDLDFYLDIYSIQLKVYILKFNVHV